MVPTDSYASRAFPSFNRTWMRAVRQLKTLAYCGGLTRRQSSRKWHSATLHVSSPGPDEINCPRKFLLTRANNLMTQISDTHFTQAPNHRCYSHRSPIIWMRKFHENLRIVAIACARTRKDRVRKVFQVPTRSRVSLVLACVCLKLYASIRVCIYTYVYVTCSRLKYCSSFPRRCTTRYC